jgi:hypothetical protein
MLSLKDTFRATMQKRYAGAPLDAASFFRSYASCAGGCAATCCSGGSAFYMPEEATTVRKVVEEHRDFFLESGIPVDGPYLDEEWDEEAGQMEISTNVKPMDYAPGVIPEHFDKTACVFRRTSDGACTLQALSVKEGKPGWWFKPLACWLFPLEIERSGKPYIHVAHASTDEYVDADYPGFVGYTGCGKECPAAKGGKPAYAILEREIAELSSFLERDLLSEIMQYKEKVA